MTIRKRKLIPRKITPRKCTQKKNTRETNSGHSESSDSSIEIVTPRKKLNNNPKSSSADTESKLSQKSDQESDDLFTKMVNILGGS